jgi:hypothetical protein
MIESLGGKILAVGRLDNGTAITIVLPLPSREVL